MVICLERGADLHMAQLMPLPLTVSCFSKIQIGFTFLVPTHPGSPVQRAFKRVLSSSLTEYLATRCAFPGSRFLGARRPGIPDIFHSRIPVHEADRIPGNVRQGKLLVTAAERLLFDTSAVWEGGSRLLGERRPCMDFRVTSCPQGPRSSLHYMTLCQWLGDGSRVAD